MAFQRYQEGDIEFARQIMTVRIDDDDLTDLNDPSVSVGDSVRIKAKGKGEGKIGVIVQARYGTVIVEPYNDPYYNDPRMITKLGPYSVSEVEKVKRPKGASTEYRAPVRAVNEESIADVLGDGNDTLREQVGGTALLTPKRRGRPAKADKEAKPTKQAKRRGRKAAKLVAGTSVNAKQQAQLKQAMALLGNGNVIRERVIEVSNELFGKPYTLIWICRLDNARVKRGLWSMAAVKKEAGLA